MERKTIAIIGATEERGAAIARQMAGNDNLLLLFSHETEKLKTLIAEIRQASPHAKLESSGCAFEASWEADVIVNAMPLENTDEIVLKISTVATQKLVLGISEESVAMMKKKLPHSKVELAAYN